MKKTRKIKRSIIYISIVLLFLIFSFTCFFINKKINDKEQILWGNSTSNFDVKYKVYNNDDKFYDDEYLDEYGSYVSSITEKIDFSIKYYFETTKNLNIDYTYSLSGEVLAEVYESGTTSPVWSKKLDVNFENKEQISNGNYLQVDKNVSIPFKEYNDMMIEYKNKYRLNISSYVKFTITVNINSLKEINSNISNTDKLVVKIPLLQPTYKIDINKSVSNNRDIFLQTKVENNDTFLKLGIYGITTTIIMSLVLLILYRKTRTKKELYKERVNTLLKKYEDIIITINELPNIENLETIEITNFNDLIDLEETLKIPIMYLDIETNKESWFMLIHNNYFYIYVIKINNKSNYK